MFDDKDKADIMQDQFASVFTKPNDNLPEFNPRTNSILGNILITREMVRKKILALDVSKSVGPDEISPRLLREIADHVSNPLTLLFNKSLQEHYVPKDWRTAYISPIFKKCA